MNTTDNITRVASYVYDGEKFATEFEALKAQAVNRISMLPDLDHKAQDELEEIISSLTSSDAKTLSGILSAMCPGPRTETPNRCFTTAPGQC